MAELEQNEGYKMLMEEIDLDCIKKYNIEFLGNGRLMYGKEAYTYLPVPSEVTYIDTPASCEIRCSRYSVSFYKGIHLVQLSVF